MSKRPIDATLLNTVVDEGERIIIYGSDLAESVIHDVLWEGQEFTAAFTERFAIDSHDYMAEENFYQGISFTRIITRKADGKQFGFTYWRDISKHGESYVEPNGEEHGIEWDIPYGFDWDTYFSVYVFTPVETFTITGYRTIKENN